MSTFSCAHEKIVCMAMDAFRVVMGIPPKNFTKREVAQYIARRVKQ